MNDKPRTWVIQEAVPGFASVQGNHPFTEQPVRVIELDPMLDLLERVRGRLTGAALRAEIDGLLREHGRLEET